MKEEANSTATNAVTIRKLFVLGILVIIFTAIKETIEIKNILNPKAGEEKKISILSEDGYKDTSDNNKKETKEKIDWYSKHEQDGVNSERIIANIEAKLKRNGTPKFISPDDDEVLPSFEELEKRMEIVLRDFGMVIIGDSTWRMLYGAIWCLMEGIFREKKPVGMEDDVGCGKLQGRLRKNCKGTKIGLCEHKANFNNESRKDLVLEHIPNYHNGHLETLRFFKATNFTEQKMVIVGFPCLHSLWSPGSRETIIRSNHSEWKAQFQYLYDDLTTRIPNNSPLILSTAMSICNSKLGVEKKFVDLFLRNEPFLPKDDKLHWRLLKYYNNRLSQKDWLPLNYTGPVPTYYKSRQSHFDDIALFDEAGGQSCSRIGLETLLSNNETKNNNGDRKNHNTNSAIKTIIDMHKATMHGCNDTFDGRHYARGETLQKMLTLLLKTAEVIDST